MDRLARVSAVVVALTVVTGVYAYQARREELVEKNLERAGDFLSAVQGDIERTLASSAEDARSLAGGPFASRAVGDPAQRAALAEAYRAFVEAKPGAVQLRLLDLDGNELVRVERSEGLVRVVPEEALQNKADRYYFLAALRLRRGEVYTSRLDLNVERGQIEHPPRAVIRFAAPVEGPRGETTGIAVLNVDAQPIIDSLERQAAVALGTLFIAEPDGTYLFHPDAKKRWGSDRMLATGEGLAVDDAELAEWLREGASLRFGSPKTLAVSTPIRQLDGAPRLVLAVTRAHMLAVARPEPPPLFWWLGVLAIAASIVLFFLWRRSLAQLEVERAVTRAKAATITETAAVLAHETRNPLAAIVTSASLLAVEPALDEDNRRLLGVVRAEAARLGRTLDELMSVARPPAPRMEKIDLRATVVEVATIAARDPAYRDGVQLVVEPASDRAGEVAVHMDPDQLRQVLWNLLLNAAAASRRANGHQVSVRVRRAELAGRATAQVEIEDDGPGMASLGDDRSGPTRGGVGLIVSAGILARRGGQLDFRPAPRQGTIVSITLPIGARTGEERRT